MPDFLPRRDADLVTWSATFGRVLEASPNAYGVTPEEVAGFVVAQQVFAQRYAVSQSRVTRTAVSVRVKDTARDEMIRLARPLAARVRARRAITNEQLMALGLRPRGRARRAVARPRVSPLVRVVSVEGRRLSVRIEERSTGRCRKPADVASAVLLYWLGESLPRDAAAWHLWGVTGRLRGEVAVNPDVLPGTKVWLTGYWQNDRHEAGPWALPTVTQVEVDLRLTVRGLRLAG